MFQRITLVLKLNILLLSLLLGMSLVSGIENINCDHSEKFISYLDVAEDMISKVKFHFHLLSAISKNCRPMDCADVLSNGHNKSGIYTIWSKSRVIEDKSLDVYCDMDTDGGGWTVIQRRGDFNRSEDYFFKDWTSYKKGFGNVDKDFWLGNDNIFALTNQRYSSIRFDLQATDGEKRYAHYDSFWIDDGDSMSEVHHNYQFSTKDRDNDQNNEFNCAVKFKGAWWYSNCHLANLNGLYMREPLPKRESGLYSDGINWAKWKGHREVLPATEMKVRPRSFEKTLKGFPPFQI
ncbi:unnamed protein product [Larinioides sclopetarius]|uniref:Fibrinogen C-terminal domain-containing protein n=1 Tax=Larinioides sclopetarius TaxID=280406 RepID=A0AAV2AT16_9ARAC